MDTVKKIEKNILCHACFDKLEDGQIVIYQKVRDIINNKNVNAIYLCHLECVKAIDERTSRYNF